MTAPGGRTEDLAVSGGRMVVTPQVDGRGDVTVGPTW